MKKETSQVASERIERLDSHLDDERIGNPFFPERGVQPFPLTPSGFKIIQRLDSDKKTAFVDGGNQEILGAPNFSVQLNRVYFSVWNGKHKGPRKVHPKADRVLRSHVLRLRPRRDPVQHHACPALR